MLVFKYIPNILKDEGRIIKELPFVANKSLQNYLKEAGIELSEHRIIVTGKVVTDLTASLKCDDEVIVTPNVNWAALVVIGDFLWTYGAVIMAVVSVAYSIYSICNRPRTPTFNVSAGGGLDEGSPTYGWDGVSNTQDVGVPIPIVYGAHRIGGNRIIKL